MVSKEINVVWYGNLQGMYRGWWDMQMLEDMLQDCTHHEGIKSLSDDQGAIVIIPGRGLIGEELRLGEDLKRLPWVVLVVAGDEERKFDITKVHHPNMHVWVQNPDPEKDEAYTRIGCGYTPGIKEAPKSVPVKELDWFFAGQITHDRREQMVGSLLGIDEKYDLHGELVKTPGFTQGLSPKEYYAKMASAKVAPCPSGPVTPDTFRLFEALEMGAVPIADTKTTNEDWVGFWTWLFEEEPPFPVLSEYTQLPGYIEDTVNKYPAINNRVQAWWIRYKRNLKNKLYRQISELEDTSIVENMVTVVIPVSPIPSHPGSFILNETIDSVRHHLSHAEIILTFDGVREEQEGRRGDYEEHIRRVLWEVKDQNVYPVIFDNHMHQVGMAREVIDKVQTPLILYMEQDTPLVTDYEINWSELYEALLDGVSNMIRFHHEGVIPKEHEPLMLGKEENYPLMRTVQWSQRPHLATTAFYKRILSEHFSDKSKCFIEDLVHGKLMNDWNRFGFQGWNQWRTHIYYPSGQIKRSYHTDGRAGAQKYDDTQIW